MAKIIWTDSAINDINAIAEYIASDSVYYAQEFVKSIFKTVEKLERYPEVGHPLPELLSSGLRQLLHKRYRIIYRFEADTIFIYTVHHSSRLLSNNQSLKDYFE